MVTKKYYFSYIQYIEKNVKSYSDKRKKIDRGNAVYHNENENPVVCWIEKPRNHVFIPDAFPSFLEDFEI
jgi:hypothetical protein